MSATDANRFVLRFARQLTGRSKIAVMDWCYHGTVDETLVIRTPDGGTQSRPGAIGPSVDPSLTTRVATFNDIEDLERIFSYGDVACLLMEPALTNIGIVLPEPGYLEDVRELTRKHGVLLVIDETHTICVGPGGSTAAWKLEPDFLVIGKPIAGGMPAAAYGMTADIASRLTAILNDNHVDVSGVGGTLTANALALSAIRATLSSTLLEEDFQYMIPLATQWASGVRNSYEGAGLDWHVQQLGCRAEYWFCPPPKNGAEAAKGINDELDAFMHLFCLNRGILLAPFHNMVLLSPFHTQQDVDRHTEVFTEATTLLAGSV
jgi:glutamate-1-semialdehyde 2,1-aminomutase